jgi:hypothetical protein
MPAQYRKVNAAYCPLDWFEEDCEVSLVILSFPQFFTDSDIEGARLGFEHGWLAYAVQA